MAAQSEPTHLDPQESSVCRKIQSLAELPLFFCKNCLSKIPAAVLSYRCKCCEEFDLCQHCYDSGIRCSDVTSHISKQRNFSDYMMEEASRTIYLSLFYRRYPVDSLCNQIRLLHVLPADSFDTPIHAYLTLGSLDAWPFYYALSYCWGTDPSTSVMNISSEPIAITKTLELALKRIRAFHQYFIIWVDALCINQSDNAKKAAQVEMMRTIYSRAKRVYVYLGEPSKECLSKPPFSNGREQDVPEFLEKVGLEKDSYEDKLCITLFSDLVASLWFGRAWIVQESSVNLKVEFIYGSLTIDFVKS